MPPASATLERRSSSRQSLLRQRLEHATSVSLISPSPVLSSLRKGAPQRTVSRGRLDLGNSGASDNNNSNNNNHNIGGGARRASFASTGSSAAALTAEAIDIVACVPQLASSIMADQQARLLPHHSQHAHLAAMTTALVSSQAGGSAGGGVARGDAFATVAMTAVAANRERVVAFRPIASPLTHAEKELATRMWMLRLSSGGAGDDAAAATHHEGGGAVSAVYASSAEAIQSVLEALHVPEVDLIAPYLLRLLAQSPNRRMYFPQFLDFLVQLKSLHAVRRHRASFDRKRAWLRSSIAQYQRAVLEDQQSTSGETAAARSPLSPTTAANQSTLSREELYDAFCSLVEAYGVLLNDREDTTNGGSSPVSASVVVPAEGVVDWLVGFSLAPAEALCDRAPGAFESAVVRRQRAAAERRKTKGAGKSSDAAPSGEAFLGATGGSSVDALNNTASVARGGGTANLGASTNSLNALVGSGGGDGGTASPASPLASPTAAAFASGGDGIHGGGGAVTASSTSAAATPTSPSSHSQSRMPAALTFEDFVALVLTPSGSAFSSSSSSALRGSSFSGGDGGGRSPSPNTTRRRRTLQKRLSEFGLLPHGSAAAGGGGGNGRRAGGHHGVSDSGPVSFGAMVSSPMVMSIRGEDGDGSAGDSNDDDDGAASDGSSRGGGGGQFASGRCSPLDAALQEIIAGHRAAAAASGASTQSTQFGAAGKRSGIGGTPGDSRQRSGARDASSSSKLPDGTHSPPRSSTSPPPKLAVTVGPAGHTHIPALCTVVERRSPFSTQRKPAATLLHYYETRDRRRQLRAQQSSHESSGAGGVAASGSGIEAPSGAVQTAPAARGMPPLARVPATSGSGAMLAQAKHVAQLAKANGAELFSEAKVLLDFLGGDSVGRAFRGRVGGALASRCGTSSSRGPNFNDTLGTASRTTTPQPTSRGHPHNPGNTSAAATPMPRALSVAALGERQRTAEVTFPGIPSTVSP